MTAWMISKLFEANDTGLGLLFGVNLRWLGQLPQIPLQHNVDWDKNSLLLLGQQQMAWMGRLGDVQLSSTW